MRDFTPDEIKEIARLMAALGEHTRDCADCAECCEDEVCPVGQKILEQLVVAFRRRD
jgi:recombinational DNA repair protein RecR